MTRRRLTTALGLLLAVAGCADSAAPAAERSWQVVVVDDVGREVRLPTPAERVISLLPAGTETLFALGAGETVVGRTRYDLEPHLAHLPSVGGGLDPSLEAILALKPDLVVAFETAGGSGIRPQIERLGIPVFAIRTQDTTDIYRTIERLGTLVGRDSAAAALASSIRSRLDSIAASVPRGRRPTALFVASIDPPIVAGPGTYLAELIGVAGGQLPDLGVGNRVEWPPLSVEVLLRSDPDVVLLPVGSDSVGPLERLRREPGWRELAAVREGRVAPVPADLVSRPGPGIAEIAAVLRRELQRLMEPQ
ncbi:MAG TPA: helical backbone metal receptor [Longimicrobiaceae bacterium]